MNPQLRPAPRLLKFCGLLAALIAATTSNADAQPRPRQQPTPRPTPYQVEATSSETPAGSTEFVLRWKATPRVARYRLQVARDAEFRDIVFDGAVNGLEHKVTGLPPGRYHWRVAPAPKETGRFSAGEEINATGAPAVAAATPTPAPTARPAATPAAVTTPAAALLRSPAHVGWQAAIGKVQRPAPARLRPGQSFDLVAVNAEGTVYALGGATGEALWTARFRPAARGAAQGEALPQVFTPLVYSVPQRETAHVLVAFDGGVRMIEGETGRELWRAPLASRPVGGAVGELDGNADTLEIAVATDEPSSLYVIEGATGRVVSQAKLQAKLIGMPIPFQASELRGVAVALEGGQLDVLRADGTRARGIRFDVPFVTPPLVIAGPQGTTVIVGTEHGLLYLSGPELKPLGRITTENDSPRGRLAAADLDGDRVIEIVMVTRRGRLAVVTADGKIKWSAEGAADAYAAAFADLDRDGMLDVLVADETVFARGFSGRDGRLIWQADEARAAAAVGGADAARGLRTLSVAGAAGSDSTLIVGGDAARNAVRAVGMPVVAGARSR